MTVGRERKTTLKDVAHEANLSVATVSAVLNGSDKFSAATQRRVWEVAHALNYTPNRQARTLRTGGTAEARSKTGIIMHVSHSGDENPVENPLEGPRSALLAWLAQQRGLYPISYWYHQRQGFQCPPVLNGLVDGAIVGTPHLDVVRLLREKLPLVLMDVPFSFETADVPMVNVDLRRGFSTLIGQVAARGHRRLGIVQSTQHGDGADVEAASLQAIRENAAKAGLEAPNDGDLAEAFNPGNHDRLMHKVADAFVPLIQSRRITVIATAGSSYAVTLYEKLTAHGIRIPEDVSLLMPYSGMDESPHGITAVGIDWSAMISTALDVLSAAMEGKTLHCREYLVSPRILPGVTLGPCPAS